MHKQRIVIGTTAGIGMLCTFVPWVDDVPWYGTLNGTKLEGGMGGFWLSSVVLVGMFIGRRNESLTPGGYGLCRIFGALIALTAIYAIAQLSRIGADSHISVGPYLVIVAGIAIAVLPNIVEGSRPPADPTSRGMVRD